LGDLLECIPDLGGKPGHLPGLETAAIVDVSIHDFLGKPDGGGDRLSVLLGR
jgi:hypothetical protein